MKIIDYICIQRMHPDFMKMGIIYKFCYLEIKATKILKSLAAQLVGAR